MASSAELQKQIAELQQQNAVLTARVAEPPKSDLPSGATLALIGAETVALLFLLIRGSFARNVQGVDNTIAELKVKQVEHEKELNLVKRDLPALVEVKKRQDEHEKDLNAVKRDMHSLLTVLPELKAAFGELTRTVEASRDKQAAFYRTELEKAQQEMRQDMTRAVSPDLQPRVTEMDRRLSLIEAWAAAKQARRTSAPRRLLPKVE